MATAPWDPLAKWGPYWKEVHPTTIRPALSLAQFYVVDVASGNNSAGVDLYVYKKTDVISSTNDNVTVLLKDTITLPLKGGINALTFMAANSDYLFVGTNRTAYAVLVAKKGFAITQTPGFSPPLNVSAITADPYGFVTVTSGSFVTGATGFYTYP
ncbi:MAG: hypothetical protein WBZ19_30415, partial [Chthoniobacterales bacterium]